MGVSWVSFSSSFLSLGSVLYTYTCIFPCTKVYTCTCTCTYFVHAMQSTCLEKHCSWVQIPLEAVHFSLEKKQLCRVLLYCFVVSLFIMCMLCRNGSKVASAYSDAETRKATIKLLRLDYNITHIQVHKTGVGRSCCHGDTL